MSLELKHCLREIRGVEFMHLLPRWLLFFASRTQKQPRTKKRGREKPEDNQREKKFPNTKMKQNVNPENANIRIYPPVRFSTKFVNLLRIASARAKTLISAVSGGFRADEVTQATCCAKTPRSRSHGRNSGGTTHGSAARTPRVARCPMKTSRNHSESGIVSPQTHGAAGRTTAQWGPQTASRGPKWHSPRLRGPKNALRTAGKPTPSQKWSETCLPKKN